MQTQDLILIGERIRGQRERLGMTRDDFAAAIGVSLKFAQDVEIGASGVSLNTLMSICEVLRLSSDYILFGTTPTVKGNPLCEMLDGQDAETVDTVLAIAAVLIDKKRKRGE